jgi:hypothetical protein
MEKLFDPFIESLPLKVKTRQEVANEYGTSTKTLIRKLLIRGVVLPPGNIFPNICKNIYYALGIPAALKTKYLREHKNGV